MVFCFGGRYVAFEACDRERMIPLVSPPTGSVTKKTTPVYAPAKKLKIA
jgi:hypothetical protein